MISIFDLINAYQNGIVAFITFVLGVAEIGVCSFALNKLILDEQFLIYIIGHAMYKKTKNLQEAMAHYSTLREYLKSDLFEIITIMKIALSIALCAGICLTLASLTMGIKRHGRKLWILISAMSLSGLVGGFGLAMKFLVQNILYMQMFLATTGVISFLLIHLLISMTIQEAYSMCTRKINDGTSETTTTSSVNSRPAIDAKTEVRPQVHNSESQTPSIALSIQEEFPLPPRPPTPPVAAGNPPAPSTTIHAQIVTPPS